MCQAKEEELRRVRMADEASALQPIDEEELAGSFEGNVVLTVDEDAPVTLTPSQASAGRRSKLVPFPSSMHIVDLFWGSFPSSRARTRLND